MVQTPKQYIRCVMSYTLLKRIKYKTERNRSKRWCKKTFPIFSHPWDSYHFSTLKPREGIPNIIFKSLGRRHNICVVWEINISRECHAGEIGIMTTGQVKSQPVSYSHCILDGTWLEIVDSLRHKHSQSPLVERKVRLLFWICQTQSLGNFHSKAYFPWVF